MKTFVAILLAALVACSTAFAPAPRAAFKAAPLAMSEEPAADSLNLIENNKAAVAAFATASEF
jgi:hypothetical protein